MPSPFPGMDPWPETPGVFPGVHSLIIAQILEALNPRLPPPYLATIDKLVRVDPELRTEPDVSAFSPGERTEGGVAAEPFADAGMVAGLSERVLELWDRPYLDIRAGEGDRLITAIELLSPSNKMAGESGRAACQHKQEEFRPGGVNAVEIDLLRGGAHTTAVPLARLRQVSAEYDYHICTTAVGEPTRHHVRPFRMTDPQPPLVVPLEPGVAPVTLELRPLFDRVYDIGVYQRWARYATRQPDPPLTPGRQAWAEGMVRERGSLPPAAGGQP
jgi:hypothetical protein